MRVTPTCDPLDDFYISQAANVQFVPDIAFGDGIYMVVWTDGRAGSPAYRVYASRVTPSGTVLDPSGIQVGPSDSQYQYSPAIVYDGTHFFATWGYYYAPYRVMARFINTNGTLSDTLPIASANGYVYKTKVAYSGSNFLVAWNEYNAGTYQTRGQVVSTDGTPVGSPFTIATSVHYYSLGLCFDGTQYCVSYVLSSGNQLWGQKIAIDGTPINSAFRISLSNNYHYYCDILLGANNCYLNVWSEYIASLYDIYANLDINILGTEEQESRIPESRRYISTIIAGPLRLPKGTTVRIFDAAGREVDESHMLPGIFFVEIDGVVTQKIVKIR